MLSRRLLALEHIFVVFSLIHYSGGLLPLILTHGASEGGNFDINSFNFALNQLGFLAISLVTLCLLILRWRKTAYVFTTNKLISLLVATAVLSCLWSVAPIETLEEGLDLITVSLFGLYLASRYSLKSQIILLGWLFAAILLLSIIFILIPPRYGIMGGLHVGALRGIYTHKNIFGQILVLAIFIFLINGFFTKKYASLWWILLTLGSVSIVLSKSTGAIVVLVGLIAVLAVCYAYSVGRWNWTSIVPATLLLVSLGGGVFLLLLNNFETVADWLGKDPTLTGRTIFWQVLLDNVAQKPWLGYGLAAFWNGFEGPSSTALRVASWSIPNAHNGFLDLSLSLGLVGILIFIVGFLVNFWRACRWLQINRSIESFWPLILLTFIFLINLAESSLLEAKFYWLLYVSISFSLSLQLKTGQAYSEN